ncbi:DNA-processing protein DprA [Oceanicella actignis]|uniref:DNA-processing protein DprA n=1 Tax=Oceanicella actignis TaxID=1189325 RepID=UPI0011E70CC5|nr:DNA-processing protein DprA [Oceanicella actignis]TYO91486.1 DNA processing protein [Oceanicella actignis]
MQVRFEFAAARPAPQDRPIDVIRLARSRNVGPATFRALLARHGSARKALAALPELAGRGGARAYEVCPEDAAARELAAAEAVGAKLLALGAPDYPAALAQIPDPPPILWAIGRVELLARPCVAIVGARNASALGQRLARGLAAELGAAGWTVVSGLARGIDAAAHAGALATGTVAATAGGADKDPAFETAELARRMRREGLVLSEQPMGAEPQAQHFPRRNRIISGLSRGVALIEAAERSGSIITARCALEQGREVMCVPGTPLDPRSGGCNALIREGATLIRSAEDVMEALGMVLTPERAPDSPDAGLAEAGAAFARARPAPEPCADARLRADVARLLNLSPVEENELARLTGASLGALADALLELELAGRLERLPGGLLALAPR